MKDNLKVIVIGYNTYDTNGVFPGGTEVVTDALLKFLVSHNCNIRYYVTRKLTNKMIEMYSDDYHCEILKKSDISLESISEYNPDLIIVSVCTFDTSDITKNILSRYDKCPVLVYSHGINCCSINQGYDKSIVSNGNFYFTYLDNMSRDSHLEFGIPEDHNFRVINSVFFDNTVLYSNNFDYDVFSNARIVPQKGIYNVARLCKSANFKLGMIGKALSNNKELIRIKDELGELVDYKGLVNRNEVPHLIRKSKFLGFLPNAQEGGSPLTVLESMAIGTPVITWDDFEITSIVDPSMNIVLNHSEEYIDQFIEEYLPKIDYYLTDSNRIKLSKSTIDKYGIKSYYNRLDTIISSILKGE